MCLIGAMGCGKSVLAREFAEILGCSIEPAILYQDVTARDLLQQRYTLPNRDTAWRPPPLVTAAIEGKLLLLDLIHKVNLGTLAVVSRSIFPVHTLFRVLALVEPPVMGPQEAAAQVSSGWRWFTYRDWRGLWPLLSPPDSC
ncbi:von Willebrand factor A domain-containing protein 8-like isoform X2 [Paralichthys olivaceus]|uniref:von Willebrand factor A domain-containing protein 8-like isoform X2 n=1 Tax=Paralichthys olivaceus TaxID=8255 RepID=UPI003752BB20